MHHWQAYMYKAAKKSLPFFVVWKEVITDMQMSASHARKVVEALLLINACVWYIHISHCSSSSNETWQCQSSLFRVICFMTKVDLSVLTWSCWICQAFGDNAVSECTARHWFQKFRSGDLFLCDESCSSQSQVLDDEALKAAMQEDNSQTCGELTKYFQVSDETVRLHLHCIGKTYKLSKWVPHILLGANKQQ